MHHAFSTVDTCNYLAHQHQFNSNELQNETNPTQTNHLIIFLSFPSSTFSLESVILSHRHSSQLSTPNFNLPLVHSLLWFHRSPKEHKSLVCLCFSFLVSFFVAWCLNVFGWQMSWIRWYFEIWADSSWFEGQGEWAPCLSSHHRINWSPPIDRNGIARISICGASTSWTLRGKRDNSAWTEY